MVSKMLNYLILFGFVIYVGNVFGFDEVDVVRTELRNTVSCIKQLPHLLCYLNDTGMIENMYMSQIINKLQTTYRLTYEDSILLIKYYILVKQDIPGFENSFAELANIHHVIDVGI